MVEGAISEAMRRSFGRRGEVPVAGGCAREGTEAHEAERDSGRGRERKGACGPGRTRKKKRTSDDPKLEEVRGICPLGDDFVIEMSISLKDIWDSFGDLIGDVLILAFSFFILGVGGLRRSGNGKSACSYPHLFGR